MRTLAFLCHLSNASHDAGKAIEDLAYQLDTKQWIEAGVSLGRLEEIGNRLISLSRLARGAAKDDEFAARTNAP